MLITGGAGFIGTNLAARLARDGCAVLIYDNLSRPGVEGNLCWLRSTFGDRIAVEVADTRDEARLRRAVAGAECVYHFAAQVAVTTSLAEPVADFEANARGTLNLLEACRRRAVPPPLVFTSANKVYGSLDDLRVVCNGCRYVPRDESVRRYGIDETRPLDFHSPYGCSKGAADQYVLDYARCYGLPTVVFRMSCIYGPHQCGNEDQGWVAHFARQALRGEPITLYGDGRQVRDILYVDDLVRAMRLAAERIERTAGRAFNIGGGPPNAVSLLDVLELIGELGGQPLAVGCDNWRQGDQRYYVSDTRAFEAATGWTPNIGVRKGLRRLYRWLEEHIPVATETALASS